MRTFLLLVTVTAFWLGAFGVVASAHWNVVHFLKFGADLPAPTLVTIDAARYHVPWMLAVAASVLLAVLYARASPRFIAACAIIAAVGMLAVAIATIVWVLPNYTLCGEFVFWPAWPWDQPATGIKTACR